MNRPHDSTAEPQLGVRVVFTPETRARHPSLEGWLLALRGPAFRHLASVHSGDLLALEGVPVDAPLVVVARQWAIMNDEATLTLILGPAEASDAPVRQ